MDRDLQMAIRQLRNAASALYRVARANNDERASRLAETASVMADEIDDTGEQLECLHGGCCTK